MQKKIVDFAVDCVALIFILSKWMCMLEKKAVPSSLHTSAHLEHPVNRMTALVNLTNEILKNNFWNSSSRQVLLLPANPSIRRWWQSPWHIQGLIDCALSFKLLWNFPYRKLAGGACRNSTPLSLTERWTTRFTCPPAASEPVWMSALRDAATAESLSTSIRITWTPPRPAPRPAPSPESGLALAICWLACPNSRWSSRLRLMWRLRLVCWAACSSSTRCSSAIRRMETTTKEEFGLKNGNGMLSRLKGIPIWVRQVISLLISNIKLCCYLLLLSW